MFMHRLGAWNVISPLNVDVISVWLLSRELFHLSRAAKSKKLILDIVPLSSQPFNFRTHLLLLLRFSHGAGCHPESDRFKIAVPGFT